MNKFDFKDNECDNEYDEEEEEDGLEEKEEGEEFEEKSEEEKEEKLIDIKYSKEESSESSLEKHTFNNEIGEEKEKKKKTTSTSKNSNIQSDKNIILDNYSENSENLKNSDCEKKSQIQEYNSLNIDQCNALLEYIINKDKILNTIVISNNLLMNFISEKLVNHFISKNKKICFLSTDAKKANCFWNYFTGKKDIKSLLFQKIKYNKNKIEYLNVRFNVIKNNLFIINPTLLYKLLSLGFIKIEDFGLLILDDCHLCQGNHHYNLIMQEFYFYYITKNIKRDLPNIIGFTSNTFKCKNYMKKKIKIEEILKTISENLNCQIIVDPNIFIEKSNMKLNEDGKIEYIKVENYLKEKSKIEGINLILIKFFFDDMLNLCLKDYIKIHGETEELNFGNKIEIKKKYLNSLKEKYFSENLEKYNNIETSNRNLHFLSHNSILFKTFEDMQRHLFNIIQNTDIEEIYQFFENYKNLYEKNFQQKENKDNYLIKIYSKMITIFKICMHAFKILIEKKVKYENDRLNKLNDILINIYNKNKNYKILIYVSNRNIANILNSYLNRDKKENFFKNKTKFIVGSNAKKEENIALTLVTRATALEIKERIKEFDEGKINILICTPPTMEYLDKIICDSIILFNEVPNINGFLEKIKTKSNNFNSKIIIFSTINNSEEKNVKKYEIKEDKKDDELKTYFIEGDKIKIDKDFREKNFIKNKNNDKNNYYYISETEAKISFKNCMMIFNEINNIFISKGVKININKKTKKVEEKEQYVSNISFNYKDDNVQFISGLYMDKQSSENECYMKFLMFLHQKRIIDNNFQLLI